VRFLLKGAKIATKRNLAIKMTIPLLQKNTGRITEADFVRFLLKGAKIAPQKKAASKITSFVTEEHWTNYGGRFREIPAEGG
jgi:hypothetical protein